MPGESFHGVHGRNFPLYRIQVPPELPLDPYNTQTFVRLFGQRQRQVPQTFPVREKLFHCDLFFGSNREGRMTQLWRSVDFQIVCECPGMG